MITSSPSFQFTGVATLYFAVNCNESITRRISSKVASSARWISDHQFDFLVWSDHKDRAHCEHVADLRMDHVVEFGDLVVRIGNHGEIERRALRFLDVLGPSFVGVGLVDAETDHFDTALFEVWLAAGHITQLGGANGREVLGMGEQNRPTITNPFVKTDGAFCRVCCENRVLCRQVVKPFSSLLLSFGNTTLLQLMTQQVKPRRDRSVLCCKNQ